MSTILPSVPQPQTDQLLGILQSLQGSFPTQLAAAIADWDTPLRAATGEKIIDVHLRRPWRQVQRRALFYFPLCCARRGA